MDNTSLLNGLDLAIVLVIVISTGIGLARGFGREILSLINFVAAFVIARLFSPMFAGILAGIVESPALRGVIAYSALFFMCTVVGSMVMHLVAGIIRFGGLQMYDRIIGSVFGFGRGMILVLVAVGVANWGGWFVSNPVWQGSHLLPNVLHLETWSRQLARLYLFEHNWDGLNQASVQTLMQNEMQHNQMHASDQRPVADPQQILQMIRGQ